MDFYHCLTILTSKTSYVYLLVFIYLNQPCFHIIHWIIFFFGLDYLFYILFNFASATADTLTYLHITREENIAFISM